MEDELSGNQTAFGLCRSMYKPWLLNLETKQDRVGTARLVIIHGVDNLNFDGRGP